MLFMNPQWMRWNRLIRLKILVLLSTQMCRLFFKKITEPFTPPISKRVIFLVSNKETDNNTLFWIFHGCRQCGGHILNHGGIGIPYCFVKIFLQIPGNGDSNTIQETDDRFKCVLLFLFNLRRLSYLPIW